jgi:hypothetical protein
MDELVAAGAVDAEEFAPLRTGLDPRESAGSAGVRPEQQYAGRAAEGVDEANLVASAWSRRRVEPAKSRGFDESDAELQRLGLREEAGAEQIERLKGHQFGPYRFEPNNAAEQAALDAIGKDYDSLVDFIIDMAEKGRAFSPFEQRVLEPLRADIEQRIQISYKTMRQMRREGAYRTTTWSQEEYDAAMELQFYSYIANAIDTNGTRASHSLKETQNIKAHRNRHSAKIKAGKPIDDIFGVKC